MPCESACQISTNPSSIGAPSPSIPSPRTRIRWPIVSSSVKMFSPPKSRPKEKNGPTVWLGVCLRTVVLLLVFKGGHPRAGEDDVKPEAKRPLRDGNIVGIQGNQA